MEVHILSNGINNKERRTELNNRTEMKRKATAPNRKMETKLETKIVIGTHERKTLETKNYRMKNEEMKEEHL